MPEGVILHIRGLRTSPPEVSSHVRDAISSLGETTSAGDVAALCLSEVGETARCLRLAEDIILFADRHRLFGPGEPSGLRMGLAAGDITSPWEGAVYAVAEQISQTAALHQILVDPRVRIASNLASHHFVEVGRDVYEFRTGRLMKGKPAQLYRNNLVGLYPDRRALQRDFAPTRLMSLAETGSELFVAGRTLISWAKLKAELIRTAIERKVAFRFLVSSKDSSKIFGESERNLIVRDLEFALKAFGELAGLSIGDGSRKSFETRETPQAVVDGLTCVRLRMPGSSRDEPSILLVILDINAALGEKKPSLVFACGNSDRNACSCTAHGLLDRTTRRFDLASSLPRREPSLFETSEGMSARNNNPTSYAPLLKGHFDAVIELERPNRGPAAGVTVPAPLCVQFQVSGKCSTYCVMCDHHRERKEGLREETWESIFEDVAKTGVGSCIFSGGEPLTRIDIPGLLRKAKRHFRIGLLTNGTIESPDVGFRKAVMDAVEETVDWVAISIDGPPEEDKIIRRPEVGEDTRLERLREFCSYFRSKMNSANFERFLTATVTLQQSNIGTDLRRLCDFIHQDLGIPQVNFKFATGAREALDPNRPPDYLPDGDALNEICRLLWQSGLTDEPGNNLDYLRRCLARGVFALKDIRDGQPLYSYYTDKPLRCFTPFTFALIDLDGSVYPCCHLYRDNHGFDKVSAELRKRHRIGELVRTETDGENRKEKIINSFSTVWNGEEYARKRNELTRISPNERGFSPCGECTRYCQHNITLNALYHSYREDREFLNRFEATESPVWI